MIRSLLYYFACQGQGQRGKCRPIDYIITVSVYIDFKTNYSINGFKASSQNKRLKRQMWANICYNVGWGLRVQEVGVGVLSAQRCPVVLNNK